MGSKIKKLRKEHSNSLFENEKIDLLEAKDAMIKPALIYSDYKSEKIIQKLKKEHINVCIVIEKDGTFVGEISVEDLIKVFLHQARFEPLTKILNRGYRREILYKSAKDLINKHRSTVFLDTPINRVIELVHKSGFNYIPVIDKNKKVLGVITPSSLLNLLRNY